MHDVELSGIDGSNLLGYLAALGTLRVLSASGQEMRMSWREKTRWTPVLHSDLANANAVVDALEPLVCGASTLNEACRIGKDLRFSRAEFRKFLVNARHDRVRGDFLVALGSDAFGSDKDEQISDTEFRTMSGAGHQHFLGSMSELAETTTPSQIRRALFETWDYADDRPALRWDAADYRPHALRAENPSGDPIRTMRGANRLAVEALPLFPTAPVARRLSTVAFSYRDCEVEITCPIWTDRLDAYTVRSLLTLPELQNVNADALRRRGVEQAFRAMRFTEGKFRNFSPSRPVM